MVEIEVLVHLPVRAYRKTLSSPAGARRREAQPARAFDTGLLPERAARRFEAARARRTGRSRRRHPSCTFRVAVTPDWPAASQGTTATSSIVASEAAHRTVEPLTM